MLNLTIYGRPSSTYEYAKNAVLEKAAAANIELSVSEVSDSKQFMVDMVDSTPAFRIGEEMKSIGHKPVNQFITEVNQWLLKKENFGTMKKFIVPTDFSDSSLNAARYATQLAAQTGGIVQLLHIYYPTPVMVNEMSYIDPAIENIKKAQLEKTAQKIKAEMQLNEPQNVLLDSVFKTGFPADVLVELSKTEENIIIVMGSTGETDAMKKLFGSVSIKVAKESECPVIIVPPQAAFRPIKNIAYCANSIELDSNSVQKVIHLIKPFDAFVHLVHVAGETAYQVNDLLNLWSKFYPKSKIDYKELYGENLFESINSYSTQRNIDLIAMSTKKRGFWSDLFHKSVTKEMAINALLPLLITHNQTFDFFK